MCADAGGSASPHPPPSLLAVGGRGFLRQPCALIPRARRESKGFASCWGSALPSRFAGPRPRRLVWVLPLSASYGRMAGAVLSSTRLRLRTSARRSAQKAVSQPLSFVGGCLTAFAAFGDN